MRCSYCIQEAEFKCGCQQPYMCGIHLATHIKTTGNHEIEVFDINLEQPRLQNLKSETLKRIKKINEAEKLIAFRTESIIKTIEKVHKEAIKRLDSLRKNYFEILEHKKFCTSELPIIEKIETIELHIKTVEIDQIINLIEKNYGVDLVNYLEEERLKKEREDQRRKKEDEERRRKEEEERLRKQKEVERRKKEEEERRRKEEEERPERSNSYIEMSLKEKIDYYHPIVFQLERWDLNWCHEVGRELLVSNDGKYLFFCKLHLGI